MFEVFSTFIIYNIISFGENPGDSTILYNGGAHPKNSINFFESFISFCTLSPFGNMPVPPTEIKGIHSSDNVAKGAKALAVTISYFSLCL